MKSLSVYNFSKKLLFTVHAEPDEEATDVTSRSAMDDTESEATTTAMGGTDSEGR